MASDGATTSAPAPSPKAGAREAGAVAKQISLPIVVAAAPVQQALLTGDVVTLRDALQAAGMDHQTIRALVDGVLWRRYQQENAARRIEALRNAWWRGGTLSDGKPALTLWGNVNRPMRTTLGINSIDVAEVELRYAFLPPEKQRLLAKIDLDYGEMRANASMTRAQVEESRLLAIEREKDVLAVLTPEERAEYEVRFTGSPGTAVRFAAMDATEAEARAIKPLINAYDEQTRSLRSDDRDFATARFELEQRTIDQLVAKVGYDRALDYAWATGSGPYVPTVKLMQELNLPTSKAAQLLQLAAETGARGAVIHADPMLTSEQKQSALAALQVTVRPQLDALVPAEAQSKLNVDAISWFTALGQGRYVAIRPVVSGNAWARVAPTPVSAPLRTPSPPIALPRRSGN